MTPNNLVLDALSAAVGLGAAVFLFKRLPLVSTFAKLVLTANKAFYVIGAKGISDHWKEWVLSRYALRIMIGSLCGAIYILAIVGWFATGFVAVLLPFVDAPQIALARLLRWEPHLMILVMGILLLLNWRWKRR